jgi:large subunit ribosomal protein L30
MAKIAAIRIKGETGLPEFKRRTMTFLNLGRKHNCVIIEDKPELVGMLKLVEDCITWGPVSEETIKLLTQKKKPLKGKIFALSPPRGGFEKKGIKAPYSIGGVVGKRDQIDTLLRKMI